MKVYILTDMEGISLAYHWDHVKEGTPYYRNYQNILTNEVNATVEGALAAGASTVIVNDGHGGGSDYNLLWEKLHSSAILEKPGSSTNILTSLDESFHALLLVGYHAMEGTPLAVMPHTQSHVKWKSYEICGQVYGEIGQMALIAGDYGVPVAYISGDLAAVQEARQLLGPDLPNTVVKWGHPNGKARSLHPEQSARQIRADVERALQFKDRKPFYFPGPYEITVRLKEPQFADEYVSKDIRRVDEVTISKTVNSAQYILDL